MSEWKEYKLGDIVDVAQGLAINAKTKHLLSNSGLPLLRITDLIHNTQVQFVNKELAPKQTIANMEDIIYTRTGQVGLVFKGKIGIIHNNCFKVIPKNNIVTRNYIYWFLRQSAIKEIANSIASGSVQKDLNHSAFKSINIKVPEIDYQNSIAEILSSLDDKIELNNKINQELESLAQTLFNHWFIDFEFPNENGEPYKSSGGEMVESELGEIPKGWEVYAMNELLETVSKTYPLKKVKEVIFLNTGDIQDGKFLHKNLSNPENLPGQAKKSISENDILYSEIRPANKRFAYVYFNASQYVVSTKLMVMRSKVEINSLFQFFYLTQKEVIDYLQQLAESRSGTFPQITFSEVSTIKIALPNFDLVNTFVEIALKPYYNNQFCKEEENESLTKLRDILLPKLISGEIEINEIAN
jgi:type I restriction enzyme S subunit